MSLRMIVTDRAPLAEAELLGTLDRDSARVLRLRAQSLMATGHRVVVLDVTRLEAVDDAGIAVLAYVRRIYRIAGGTLSMVGLGSVLEARLARFEEQERRASARIEPSVLIR